jgi:hypothetical protein
VEKRANRGLLLIRGASGSGKTRSCLLEPLWRITLRAKVLEKLHDHQYPIPIPFLAPRDHPLEGHSRIEFASLLQTFSATDTIGEILGGRERLWREWRRKRAQACPTCHARVNSSPSLSRIMATTQEIPYEEVAIFVVRTQINSEKRPRTFLRSSSSGESEIENFVDRIVRGQSTAERRLEDGLRAALEPGDGRLELRFILSNRDSLVRFYDRTPICEQCGTAYERISRSTFSLKLNRDLFSEPNTTFERWAKADPSRATIQSVRLGNSTLRDLLRTPLGDLPDDPTVFPSLRSFASSLRLERLTLLRPFTTLSTTEQLRVLLLKTLIARSSAEPIVVDGILGGFDPEERAELLQTLSHQADKSLIVVIDPEGWATQEHQSEWSRQDPVRNTNQVRLARQIKPPRSEEIESLIGGSGPSIVSVRGPARSGKSLAIEDALRALPHRNPAALSRWNWYDPCALRPAATLVEFLEISEPLFALLAESEGARMEGIRAKELSRRSRVGMKNFCRTCSGLGFIFEECSGILYGTTCSACAGSPLIDRLERATFRGLSWPGLARLSVEEAAQLTRGVSPINRMLERLNHSGCHRPPIGLPVALLSQREWHVCSLLKELCTVRRDGIAICAHPFAGLDDPQSEAVLTVIESICVERNLVVIIEKLASEPGIIRRELPCGTPSSEPVIR